MDVGKALIRDIVLALALRMDVGIVLLGDIVLALALRMDVGIVLIRAIVLALALAARDIVKALAVAQSVKALSNIVKASMVFLVLMMHGSVLSQRSLN